MSFKHTDPRKDQIDLAQYSPDNSDPSTKYGLPQKIAFCSECVISNQRPNSAVEYKHTSDSKKQTIAFGDNGVCDACTNAKQKHGDIDWEERRRELEALCDKYRSRNGSNDCLVPGSGGKDSFYQSWMLKYEFGMNPLTVTWAPHSYTDSALMDIPLVFYGENEAEYGNPIADNTNAKRDHAYFAMTDQDEIYLGGTSVKSLIEDYGVRPADLNVYLPSDPAVLEAKGTEVHYLGYYLKWHPQAAYYFAVDNGGFEASPERTPGTYSKYNSIDDKIDDLHYYTTYIKFGIGRATYDASQEVRSLDIEREEAVALVKRYDGEYPDRFADELMTYLSVPEKEFPEASKQFESPVMDREYFAALANRFRPPHLWSHENDEWALRRTVFSGN